MQPAKSKSENVRKEIYTHQTCIIISRKIKSKWLELHTFTRADHSRVGKYRFTKSISLTPTSPASGLSTTLTSIAVILSGNPFPFASLELFRIVLWVSNLIVIVVYFLSKEVQMKRNEDDDGLFDFRFPFSSSSRF
jgi:hypothetical protein